MTTSAIPTSSAARRRTPLAQTCGVPHSCDDAVRMRVLSRVPYFAGLSREQLEGIDRRMHSLSWADGIRSTSLETRPSTSWDALHEPPRHSPRPAERP